MDKKRSIKNGIFSLSTLIGRSGMIMLLASATAVLIACAVLFTDSTRALLTDSSETLDNEFNLTRKHTLEYHGNASDEVKNLPPVQTEYNDEEATFTISSKKPTRDGFVFQGWYLTPDPDVETDQKYLAGDTYKTTDVHTDMYAQWETGFTLIYDANGGSNAPEADTVTTSESSHTFSILSQGDMKGPEEADGSDDHRIFLGWADSPEATVPDYTSTGDLEYDNEDGDYDGDKMTGFASTIKLDAPVKTKTVYAVWATKYILDFSLHPKLEGSEGPVPEKQTLVTTDDSHRFMIPERVTKEQAEEDPSLKANAPSRKYKYYWGWWSDHSPYKEDGITLDEKEVFAPEFGYDFNEPYDLTWDDPERTLYACFQPPDIVSLIYDRNAAKVGGEDSAKLIEKWPPNSKVSSTEQGYNPKITTLVPTHPQYEFLGWSRDQNAAEPDADAGAGMEYSINKYVMYEVTLYAVWNRMHRFRVTFDGNSATTVYHKNNEGKWTTGAGWYEVNDPSDKEAFNKESKYHNDYEYKWSSDFWANNGLFAVKAEDSYGEYVFKGWSYKRYPTRGNGEYRDGDPVDFPVDAPADPSSPEGTEGLITDEVSPSEASINAAKAATKPNYYNTTLYAVWRRSPKHSYQIEFSQGSGSGLYKADTITGTRNYYSTGASDRYVAAIGNESYTFTASPKEGWDGWSGIADPPIVTKKDYDSNTETNLETNSYRLAGWATGTNPNAANYKVYRVDDDQRIIDDIELKESAADALDCPGGAHKLTLYPLFEKVPHHKFNVFFEANAPTLTGLEMNIRYKDPETGEWKAKKNGSSYGKKKDVAGETHTISKGITFSSDKQDQSVGSFDFGPGYWEDNGVYVSVKNPADTTQKFKFLGWSYKKMAPNTATTADIDFPVTAPDDPDTTPSAGSTDGLITGTITVSEPEEGDNKCTDEKGQNHNRVLYGVWEYDKMHQYAVQFNPNGASGSAAKVRYRENGAWKTSSGSSLPKDTLYYEPDPETGAPAYKKTTAAMYAWPYKSPALRMPAADPTSSYTFEAADWEGNDIGVNAERTGNNKIRYEFLGWSTTKQDAVDDEADATVDYHVNERGYITDDIEIKDDHYDTCSNETSEIHNIILYAVWKKVPVHSYRITFTANGGKAVQYRNGTNWANSTATIYRSDLPDIADTIEQDRLYNCRQIESGKFDRDSGETTDSYYTWEGPKWKTDNIGMRAVRDSVGSTRYIFRGWADTPNAEDPNVLVDSDGFIISDVKVDNTDTAETKYDIHNKVLYAVWGTEDIPPEHSFTINFSFNKPGGTSTPSSTTYFRTRTASSGTAWRNVSSAGKTFRYPASGTEPVTDGTTELKIPKETWEGYGLGANATVGTNLNSYPCEYELVGWSTTQKAPSLTASAADCDISWEHDPDSDFAGDGFITSDITLKCPEANCTGGDHSMTVYAVWKILPREKNYNLAFDVNGGDEEDTPEAMNGKEIYNGTAWRNLCDFTMPEIVPRNKRLVFTGWSTEQNAIQGSYGYPNTVNREIEDLTADLESTYSMPYIGEADTDVRTLYAIWWYEYYLRFDANGGSQSPKLEHAYSSDAMYPFTISSSKPRREGYHFLGWATSPGATEATIQPGQRYEVNAITEGADAGYTDITLYAVWQRL